MFSVTFLSHLSERFQTTRRYFKRLEITLLDFQYCPRKKKQWLFTVAPGRRQDLSLFKFILLVMHFLSLFQKNEISDTGA